MFENSLSYTPVELPQVYSIGKEAEPTDETVISESLGESVYSILHRRVGIMDKS